LPDYSPSDGREAKRVIDSLLGQEGAPEIDERLVISDLEADAAEFVDEQSLLAEVGVPTPALRLGDALVPMSLSLLGGGVGQPFWGWTGGPRGRHWRGHPFSHDLVYYYFRNLFDERRQTRRFETMAAEEARETFASRATDFLATRLAAVRDFDRTDNRRWSAVAFINILQRDGGSIVSTPGCHFSVSTNSSGLRVFWSGAYRVSPNYFSHPTTPTVGVLQSGNYVFGVDGGAYGNQVQWDLNAHVSLPGNPHVHLNY
jgi:hypothetical protein